jgi:prepilin-type N-terminal cleavage/methylation domain-containing protein
MIVFKELLVKNTSGFTLIEVMITVAIIAILSAVAIPSYNNYMVRGKIPKATTGLASTAFSITSNYYIKLICMFKIPNRITTSHRF